MKKTLQKLLFICSLILSLNKIGVSQTTIFSETFNGAGPYPFTLNSSDEGCDPIATNNYWVINATYNSFFGNTPSQITGITGAPPNTRYLHIRNSLTANGLFLAPADGNKFVKINTPISTIGFTNVSLSFWYLCNGDIVSDSYFGRTYYSLDGGNTWVQNPTEYSQVSSWTQETITNPIFDNQPDIRFAFMWVQNSANELAATDPPFCVDDVIVQGTSSSSNTITTGIISGSPFCAGATFNVPFTSSGTFNAGNIYTAQLSDASGSFAAPTNIGTLNSIINSGTISVTIPGATGTGNGYLIRIISNNPNTVGSNSAAITINASTPPSVSISANPGNTICTNTSVTFTAVPTNGGASPSYAWTVNGSSVGTNSPTFTSNTLFTGNLVQVTMTSNASCSSPTTASSNTISMTVNGLTSAGVSISANPGNTICAGTNTIFTANPIGPGISPIYAWTLNGNPVGTNSATYSNSTLINGDNVQVSMTSSASCATPSIANSNIVSMTVNSTVVPSVSISANPGNTICAGTSVTFTAVPTNGGTSPSYAWTVNGNPVGTNSPTFTSSTLTNGNLVQVTMTSNASCSSPTTGSSNTISMTVNGLTSAAVSISANPGNTICAGTNTIFTANPIGPGISPIYAWTLNGNPVGTNSATYSNSTLINGDNVQVSMTSSASCATPSIANSNIISMTVNSTVVPSVSISANPGNTICTGTSVTFTAAPTNGGASPSYAWTVNGNPVGTNSPTFTSSSLANGANVQVAITSNANCANPSSVNSNIISMTVSASVAPSVSITANPGNTVCTGASVTFTANPINGGSSPSYAWTINGNPVGTNASTYTSNSLTNGANVQVVMTSNSSCAVPLNATSNTISMVVNPNVVPSVSISANPGNSICAGALVSFIATPLNGGSSPAFSWTVNGNPVGSNSNTFTSSSLPNGANVQLTMTSNASCTSTATANSNTISMIVNPSVTPNVSLSVSPGNLICAGATATFTAVPVNGGSNPSFAWTVNGLPAGTNSSTFSTNSLTNGSIVNVSLTSNAQCRTTTTVNSINFLMTVTPSATPTVSISSNNGNTICNGTSTTFTAAITNGGVSPSYAWTVNGLPVGTNSPTFNSNSLTNGSNVQVSVTSNASCLSTTIANSNIISMIVNNGAPLVVSANTANSTFCTGQSITFNAVTNPLLSNATYSWTVNGIVQTSTNSVFTSNSFINNDVVEVIVNTTDPCLSNTTATSTPITMTNGDVAFSSSIISDNSGAVCSGSIVNFSATNNPTPNNVSYQWYVQGVLVVGANGPTFSTAINPANNNVYAEITVSDICFSPSFVTTNSINVPIQAQVINSTISVSPNATPCAGTPLLFSSVNSPSSSTFNYQWNLNGNPLPGETNDSLTVGTYNNGDIFSITLSSNDNCLIGSPFTSNSITITPSQPQAVSVSASSNISSACLGMPVTITALGTNAGLNPIYSLMMNGNQIAQNGTGIFVTSALTLGSTVSVELNSSLSCITGNPAISLIPITITPGLNIATTSTPADCNGKATGSATALVSNGTSPYAYSWNTTPISTTGTINNQSAGTYVVTITDAQGCQNSDSVIITEPLPITLASSTIVGQSSNSNPTGSITVNIAGGTSPYSFYWNTVPPQTTNSANGLLAGNYSLTVTDSNGCSESFNFDVPNFTGINSMEGNSLLEVFPNPMNEFINVKFLNSKTNKINYQFYNIQGKLLNEGEVSANSGQLFELNTDNLSSGVYILYLQTKEGNYLKKLIK